MNKWISVEDELPKENTSVLVCFKNGDIIIRFYDDMYGFFTNNEKIITHWQPLPKLPKKKWGKLLLLLHALSSYED